MSTSSNEHISSVLESLSSYYRDLTQVYNYESEPIPTTCAYQNTYSYITPTTEDTGSKIILSFNDNHVDSLQKNTTSTAPQTDTDILSTLQEDLHPEHVLKLFANTTSHESYHHNCSDLRSKERFMEENNEFKSLAGFVLNVIEDSYIDTQRIIDYPGLRDVQAFAILYQVINDNPKFESVGTKQSIHEQLTASLLQLTTLGYVIDLKDAATETKQFVKWLEPHAKAIKFLESPIQRYTLSQQVFNALLSFIPKNELQHNPFKDMDFSKTGSTDISANPQDHAQDESGLENLDTDLDTLNEDILDDIAETTPDHTNTSEDPPEDPPETPPTDTSTPHPSQSVDTDTLIETIVDTLPQDSSITNSINTEKYKEDWERLQTEYLPTNEDFSTRVQNNHPDSQRSVNHDEIRSEIKNSKLTQQFYDAFKQLKTRDHAIEKHTGNRIHTKNVVRNRSTKTQTRPAYKHKQKTEKGDRSITLCVDCSSSMNEYKTKFAIGSLYEMTNLIGDDLSITTFSTRFNNTKLVTAPTEQFEWSHLDTFRPTGKTPTPHGIADAQQVSMHTTRPEKVMIVITDGKPNKTIPGKPHNTSPVKQSRAVIEQCRNRGITVIGLGIGNISKEKMNKMFGPNNYVHTEMNNLTQKLLQLYKKQMNTT